MPSFDSRWILASHSARGIAPAAPARLLDTVPARNGDVPLRRTHSQDLSAELTHYQKFVSETRFGTCHVRGLMVTPDGTLG